MLQVAVPLPPAVACIKSAKPIDCPLPGVALVLIPLWLRPAGNEAGSVNSSSSVPAILITIAPSVTVVTALQIADAVAPAL